MIDTEIEVYDRVKQALTAGGFTDIKVITSYTTRPSEFPCVYMEQIDSVPFERANSYDETHTRVIWQIDIYSNKRVGRKKEARAIASCIDTEMRNMNFHRSVMIHNYNPSEGTVYTNDVHDENIYRLILRYEGVATDKYFYRV